MSRQATRERGICRRFCRTYSLYNRAIKRSDMGSRRNLQKPGIHRNIVVRSGSSCLLYFAESTRSAVTRLKAKHGRLPVMRWAEGSSSLHR